MKKIIPEIFWIIVIASAMGIVYNAMNYDSLPWFYTPAIEEGASDKELFGDDEPIENLREKTIDSLEPDVEEIVLNDTAQNKIIAKEDTSNKQPSEDVAKKSNKEDSTPEEIPLDSENSIKTVTYKQVLRLLEAGTTIFVDARSAENYAKGKIGNAINIDPHDDEDTIFHKVREVAETGKRVVLYCTSEDCDLAEELLVYFDMLSDAKVYIYRGGWDEWVEKNKS